MKAEIEQFFLSATLFTDKQAKVTGWLGRKRHTNWSTRALPAGTRSALDQADQGCCSAFRLRVAAAFFADAERLAVERDAEAAPPFSPPL